MNETESNELQQDLHFSKMEELQRKIWKLYIYLPSRYKYLLQTTPSPSRVPIEIYGANF